jgi:hypothetical protein
LRRLTKVALGGAASCALILGSAQVANGALSTILREHAENLLLDPAADRPFDKAKARITIAEGSNGTTFNLTVSKIDSSSLANPELGSHLHVGPCIEESGGSAGPHYNHQVAAGDKKFPGPGVDPADYPVVSRDTEVWFDLVPNTEGVAHAETTVPFVPDDSFPSNPTWVPGVMSVVIHDGPTNPDGTAGKFRQACFPLSVPKWAE